MRKVQYKCHHLVPFTSTCIASATRFSRHSAEQAGAFAPSQPVQYLGNHVQQTLPPLHVARADEGEGHRWVDVGTGDVGERVDCGTQDELLKLRGRGNS